MKTTRTKMKKFLPLAFIAISLFITNTIFSQASCPSIVSSSFRVITDNSNACLKAVRFDFINPSNGNKRIKLEVMVNNSLLFTECIDASGQKDVRRTFTSSFFTLCNLSNLEVTMTPVTGNNCNGGGCFSTIRSIGGAPLPVIFSSFTAVRNNSAVVLNWETATEINNKEFTIERNIDGNWETIATVATQALNGNSSSILSYSYSDRNTAKGVSQYRILQTDFDGQSKYSEVRAIRGAEQEAKTTVFPNPSASGNVTVLFDNAVNRNIQITDMAGRIVKQWNNYNENSLSVTNLTSGMYTLRSINNETKSYEVQKLIVSRQ